MIPSSPRRRRRRGPACARAAVIAVQASVLAAAAFGFLASGLVPDRVRALVASWQIFPGVSLLLRAAVELALGAAALLAGLSIPALVLSAVFGRWYCASLCPLGALQDLAAFASGAERRYRKPPTAARAAAAACAVALSVAGATAAASWLDPWSLFGRFATYDIRPLAQIASRADAHGAGFWTAAPTAAAIGAILVLSVLSKSRWFCGTLCPVGSLLGLLNKAAPFRVRLDAASCVGCGACVARCPASCIDHSRARLDATRCVGCLACIGACPTKALRYGPPAAAGERRPEGTDAPADRAVDPRGGAAAGAPAPRARPAALRGGGTMSRSSFLAILGGASAALALAAVPGRRAARHLAAAPAVAVPPGARSVARFAESCTACGLCVSACPSSVLLPSLGELGPRGLLAPRLDFSVSYCQYECVSCSAVCPSGAIARLSPEEKKLVKIGTASLVREHCIVFTERTRCGACAEHCPTGAVHMVPGTTGLPEPVFESSICIGCGACHHICPVPNKRAISVAGLAVHETAEKPAAAARGGDAPTPAKGEGDVFPF